MPTKLESTWTRHGLHVQLVLWQTMPNPFVAGEGFGADGKRDAQDAAGVPKRGVFGTLLCTKLIGGNTIGRGCPSQALAKGTCDGHRPCLVQVPWTLVRWMKDSEFDAAYRAAKRTAFGQAIARLQQGTSAAATTLLKVMIDSSTPASVRVRAADSIFNHAAKAIEIEEIEARVAALEQAAAQGTHR